MRTRAWRALGVALLTLLAVALPAGPAHAAGELELSTDGSAWTTSLTAALFPDAHALVPGDVVATDLWVRNASDDRARIDLRVSSALGGAAGTLAGELRLTIDGSPAAGGSRWRGPVLEPGASTRIPLVLAFDAAARGGRLDVAVVIDQAMLVQTAVGPAPAAVPTGTVGPGQAPRAAGVVGALARTGQDVAGVAVVAGGALGAGLLLLVARRRSRRADR